MKIITGVTEEYFSAIEFSYWTWTVNLKEIVNSLFW